MGPPSSLENPYKYPHGTTNDWEKDSVGSLSSSGAPYKYPHDTTNNWGEDSVGPLGSLENPYIPQRGIEAMGKSNQELLKKQDEITSGGSSNKRLPETQVQAAIQPKSMPQVNTVDIDPTSSSLKLSHDHSQGTEPEPKQADDDDQRASADIREKYQLKRVQKRLW
ncbi:hypothetical protein BSLG_006363 [Batrachochytrium salamandrivorans]|nr:hypothetical protein BSLG_006363 [Batrachochytrium salamandrivorans]